MKTSGWWWVLAALLLGCGGPEGNDAGMPDAGPVMDAPLDVPLDVPIDAPSGMDVDVGESCEGTEEGFTTCRGGFGRSCCGGFWHEYADGPCWPPPDAPPPDANGGDAGTTCDRAPGNAGCPCADEGTTMCVGYGWQRVCTDGVWIERMGYSCCVGF